MAWQEEFGISIPDSVAAKLVTPGDAVTIICGLLEAEGRPQERSVIEEKVREITIEQIGIKEREYRLDARFVEDFEID